MNLISKCQFWKNSFSASPNIFGAAKNSFANFIPLDYVVALRAKETNRESGKKVFVKRIFFPVC